jgi:hypothetical protein
MNVFDSDCWSGVSSSNFTPHLLFGLEFGSLDTKKSETVLNGTFLIPI